MNPVERFMIAERVADRLTRQRFPGYFSEEPYVEDRKKPLWESNLDFTPFIDYYYKGIRDGYYCGVGEALEGNAMCPIRK